MQFALRDALGRVRLVAEAIEHLGDLRQAHAGRVEADADGRFAQAEARLDHAGQHFGELFDEPDARAARDAFQNEVDAEVVLVERGDVELAEAVGVERVELAAGRGRVGEDDFGVGAHGVVGVEAARVDGVVDGAAARAAELTLGRRFDQASRHGEAAVGARDVGVVTHDDSKAEVRGPTARWWACSSDEWSVEAAGPSPAG
ncbi:MAG: hypothetical protein QM770_14935 [Tepidisphaeraceae bacterium]